MDLSVSENREQRCPFCGRKKSEVKRMIASPNEAAICDVCIEICNAILEDQNIEENTENIVLPTPSEIKEQLDKYVVGQDNAKKTLSVAVYNHYKRVYSAKNKAENDGVELEKSNILMLGPTGSGKTLLAKTLARILNVPFAVADATTLTEAGYVGEDVENILLKLIQNANYDLERAQRGIVYIDEIDKIAGGANHNGPDVSREGVQRDILPIVEGCTVNTKYGSIKTDYILFVASGAFHISSVSDLIPELQGRFPVVVELNSLNKEDFVKILTEPENAVTVQYQKLLAVDNIELCFTPDGIDEIAGVAVDLNTTQEDIGARRLQALLEHLLEEVSFNVDNGGEKVKVTVDKKFVKDNLTKETIAQNLRKYIL